MSDENKKDEPKVQADNNSIAVDSLSIGGSVGGAIIIGNDNTVTTGYTAEQVAVLIAQIRSTFQVKPFDGRCPYKGLDVFEEEDAELFFGREKLVDDLVSRVKESRTVFVTGPSGSGKSSLVRAGLIHALKQGAIKNSERWLYATMKPGRDPLESLANSFSRLKSPELGNYLRKNANQVVVLHECAESALTDNKNQRLVLFIDQFEEVFTQISKEEERVAFLNLLTHAATVENGRVIIVFSMRSDFVSNCATYPQLNELLNQQFVQIGAMQPEELVSAIAQPALRVGLRIDPDLIAQIINEMKGEPGALPLMQFALKDLFDSQQEKSGVPALILNDYLQRGGIHKALERHADDSFSKLSKNEQDLARSIFSGLIEIGRGTQDTKRTALFDELVPANTNAVEVEAIIQKLADARLITTDEAAGKDTVTISHEKLIDAWPWLRKLVNENRDVIALQNEITADAKEWDEHQRDNSYLYSGARLAVAQEKIKDLVLSENAQTYLTAAKTVEENARLQSKRTQRRITTGLIVFSAIVLGLFLFSLLQLKISRAQRLGSQAQVAFAEENYNTALLYAYQSNQIYKNDAADLILSQIVYKNFPLGKPLNEHATQILSLASSADGQLASGFTDGTVTVRDFKTEQPAKILKAHKGMVLSVAWSADGQLASASDDKSIILWNLNTGQPTQTLKGSSAVNSVAWSPDGRLASGVGDAVIIWDLKTGQPTQTLKGHTSYIESLAWSKDGQLASSSFDGTVIVWDLKTGKPAQTLKEHIGSIYSLDWSPDGQLASGSWDKTVIIWDLKIGKPAQILKGHTFFVNRVRWSANGQLASGSGDGSVIIWDIKIGKPAEIIKNIGFFVWSIDGQLTLMDGTIITKAGQSVRSLEEHKSSVTSVSWSIDGQLASGSSDKTVIIWDLKTGQPTQTLKGHEDAVTSVSWSVDGQLASGSSDKTVIIWDLKTGQPAQILQGHTDGVKSIAWSANGQLASGSLDNTVIIWDLKTGQPAQILQGHTSFVTSVAWSADGQLASGSWDHTVIIWDLKTGQPAQILKGRKSWIESVAWSADGRLASGSWDGSVIIWDLKTGKPAQTLKGYTGRVYSVAWSENGQLASGSNDNSVIIWDITTGRPAQTFKEHTSSIDSLAWSVDGQLASGSADWTIKITRADLTVGDLCKVIMRNLTLKEWLDYQGPFYIYQPACANLYDPTYKIGILELFLFSGTNLSNFAGLITWKGRAALLALLLVFLALFYFILRVFYKGVVWVWRKRKIKEEQP